MAFRSGGGGRDGIFDMLENETGGKVKMRQFTSGRWGWKSRPAEGRTRGNVMKYLRLKEQTEGSYKANERDEEVGIIYEY